jgi:hypothetical protein
MKPIRIVQKPQNGRLVIEVPEELRDQNVEITLVARPEEAPLTDEQAARRAEIIRQMRGQSKDSTYVPNRYDVYNQ